MRWVRTGQPPGSMQHFGTLVWSCFFLTPHYCCPAGLTEAVTIVPAGKPAQTTLLVRSVSRLVC